MYGHTGLHATRLRLQLRATVHADAAAAVSAEYRAIASLAAENAIRRQTGTRAPSTDPIVPATQVEPAPKSAAPAPKNEPKGGGLSLIPMHTAPKPAAPVLPSPKPKAEPKVEEPTIPPLDNPRLPAPKPNLNANPPSITLPGNESSLPPLTRADGRQKQQEQRVTERPGPQPGTTESGSTCPQRHRKIHYSAGEHSGTEDAFAAAADGTAGRARHSGHARQGQGNVGIEVQPTDHRRSAR